MNPFNKILIATDGSESAEMAATRGLELAKYGNAEVTVLSVMDVGGFAIATQGLRKGSIYERLKEEADRAVDRVRREGEKMGIQIKTMIKEGSPANEIIKESENFDLVVMGTLGRTGISHLLLGSVAEKVVRLASCPVMIVRGHEDGRNGGS